MDDVRCAGCRPNHKQQEEHIMTTRSRARRPLAGLTAALALGLMVAGPWPAAAKPPDHAPAHGYRKTKDKHKDSNHDARRGEDRGHREDRGRREDNTHRDRPGEPIRDGGDTRVYDRRRPVPRTPPRVVDRRTERERRQDVRYRRQHDVDLDGIPNGRDRDMDGDGIPNNRDPQPKVFNRRGTVPNWSYNHRKRATANDMDGDGIPNSRDRDRDGDAVRNQDDSHPNDRKRR